MMNSSSKLNQQFNVSTTRTNQKQQISFPLLLLLLAIGSFSFFAFQTVEKNIPDPIAKAQGNGTTLASGIYTVEQIQNIRGVYIEQQSAQNIEHKVTYCEVTKVNKKDGKMSWVSETGMFGENITTMFKNAKEGDIFYINKIRMQFAGEVTERKMNALYFKVKKAEK